MRAVLHNVLCDANSSPGHRQVNTFARSILIPLLCIASTTTATTPRQGCPEPPSAHDNVLAVANEFFAALRTDDLDLFRQTTDPDFYAFDAGRKFVGNELPLFVKEAHTKGTHINWSITDPVVHVSCNIAWLTYVNVGSVETKEGQQAVTWLESMVLEYQHPKWYIRFLHSTRLPTAK